MKVCRTLLVFLLLTSLAFLGCQGQGILDSAGLTATDQVQLLDTQGGIPATIIFQGATSAVSGKEDPDEMMDVPFEAYIDLRPVASQEAYAAINWNGSSPTIQTLIIFTDTMNKRHTLTMAAMAKNSTQLTATTQSRQSLPIAIGKIACIELKVDGVVVASHPLPCPTVQ